MRAFSPRPGRWKRPSREQRLQRAGLFAWREGKAKLMSDLMEPSVTGPESRAGRQACGRKQVDVSIIESQTPQSVAVDKIQSFKVTS